jgi:CubicO group peptidase (beta-lactamase class C family)
MQLRSLLWVRSSRAVSVVCLMSTLLVSELFGWPEGRAPSVDGSNGSKGRMSDAQIIQDLRSHLDKLAPEDRFSGTVLVAKGDEILFEHAYGYADRAFKAPNKVDTKFNLGSMGKMFTAVSILQLAQEGKLSLQDKLIKDLPDYPNKDVASKITIYQLLTHTSGLGDFFGKEFLDSSMAKFRTLESLLPLFVDKPLQFEPGAKWSYSNAGFIVLGLVIQHVSEETYYDYAREHVFRPAGMINTDNYNTDADVPNLALGYTNMPDEMGKPPSPQRRSNIFILQRGGSAGGGYSTVEDLFRFAQALRGHKLLNTEYTDMIMTGKVPTPRPGVKYGFGMEEMLENDVRIVGHGGGGPGINSQLDMYPELGYTVAVMSNYDQGATPVANRLRWELSGQELPQAIQLSPEALETFVGKYKPELPPGAAQGMTPPPIEITADHGKLLVNVGMKHTFLPSSPTEFFDEDAFQARLTFTKDENGHVIGLTLLGAGPMPIKATKQP